MASLSIARFFYSFHSSLGLLPHIRDFSVLDKRHMNVVLYEEFSKLNSISLMLFVIRVVCIKLYFLMPSGEFEIYSNEHVIFCFILVSFQCN